MEKLLKFLEKVEAIFCPIFLLSASFSAFDERKKVTKFLIFIYMIFLVVFFLMARDKVLENFFPQEAERIKQERLIEWKKREEERAAEELEKIRREKQLVEDEQKNQAQTIEKIRKDSEKLPQVTAITFAQKYSDNQLAANKEFRGKRFRITGVIIGIHDKDGYPFVHLYREVDTGPDYDFAAPQIVFKKEYYDRISLKKKRQKITAICTGAEPTYLNHARAEDCDFIE